MLPLRRGSSLKAQQGSNNEIMKIVTLNVQLKEMDGQCQKA